MPTPVTDTDSSSDDELLVSLGTAKSKKRNSSSKHKSDDRGGGSGKKRKKLKQLKRMKKKQKKQQGDSNNRNNDKQRQAGARAEVAQLKQAQKERKLEATKAKKAASATSPHKKGTSSTGGSADGSASSASPHDTSPPKGYCDICQLTEKFKPQHMTLLRCTVCGVTVHDVCYGSIGFSKDRLGKDRKNKPPLNPATDFTCLACKALGRTVKVRDRDPFTGEYIEVKQRWRPRECCLCDIDDGVHAMHPVYDIHGSRGRQIYLPKDDDNGMEKPRRLAWAHTLCAMTICQSYQCRGAVFGCGPDGDCGDESDTELLSDSESVNSDLDVPEAAETSHFVWWGHLHRFLGKDPKRDPYSKSLINLKDGSLRCSYCGKNDQKKTRLPNGKSVYQSLRVPIQCSANNDDEDKMFKKHHKSGAEDGPCTVGLHVGCAVWGRNDEGEYRRPRACWFFPGLNAEGTHPDPISETVSESYCRCHSEELFCLPTLDGSDMSDRLPGPFEALSGPAQERFAKKNNKNNRGKEVDERSKSTRLTGRNKDDDDDDDDYDSNDEYDDDDEDDDDMEYGSYASGNNGGMLAISTAASNVAVRGRAAAFDKHPHASRARTTHTPPSRTKKRALASSSKKKAPPPPVTMRNVSLHGETKKKRAMELKKAGEAVQIQTKKHGRLAAKRNSSILSHGGGGISSSAQQQQHQRGSKGQLDVVQDFLNQLRRRRKECEQSGKPFNIPVLATLRVQLHKKFDGTKDEFDEVWKSANDALNAGILDVKAQRKNAGENDDDDGDDDPPVMGHDEMNEGTGANNGHQSQSTGAEVVGGEAKANHSQEKATDTVVDNPHAELTERIVQDILAALAAKGQTSNENSSAEVVKDILKNRKSHWKKASGLKKEEYKALFAGQVVARLEEASGWLDITGADKKKAQQISQDDETPKQAPAVAMEDPTTNEPDPQQEEQEEVGQPMDTNHVEPEPPKECGEKRDSRENHSVPLGAWPDFTAQQPNKRLEPPSRWSHLHYGPYYDKEGFRFDKWDTYEEIDRLTSDEE